MRGSRPVFQNIALACGGLAGALLLCEIALRLAGISSPHFYTFDDTVGHRLLPGARGWFRGEGKAYVEISDEGLRDREHAIAKSPNTLRIAVLGDSFAEALQVPLEESFWAVMERRVDSCLAPRGVQAEVLNFGVSGYGTTQEFLTLRDHVWKYDPDVVLLAFLTANDVQDNSKRLQPPGSPRPYFVASGDSLALDLSFRDDPAYRRKSGALWPARLALMRDEEIGAIRIGSRTGPVPWPHVVNGPLADALTHIGQINVLRRANGNPVPKANVFLGRPPR